MIIYFLWFYEVDFAWPRVKRDASPCCRIPGDMIVAGHLVPPQLEAMARHVVESQGATTSKLEPGGVQRKRSLGPLLETPEARHALGEDGVFEL